MNTLLRGSIGSLAGMLLAVMCATAVASPFVGSRTEPHAVLYLDVGQTANQLWPVRIWSVDGKLTNRSNQGVLWNKPGEYVQDQTWEGESG